MDDEISRVRPRQYLLLALLGVLVLSYIGGAYSGFFKVFPYPQVLQPYFLTLATTDETGVEAGATPTGPTPWQSTWYETFGVVQDSAPARQNTYTLYATGHRAEAVLIDRRGRRLHHWKLPFHRAWPSPPHLERGDSTKGVYWRRVHLFDNGDLLAIYTAPGPTTPQGYGMVKVDIQSNVVWKFNERTHHDFALDSNGDIFALTHHFRATSTTPAPEMPQLPDRVLADELVRLSPDGKERERIDLLEALADSPYRESLEMHPTTVESSGEQQWDVLHTNSVAVVGPEFADKHEFAEPGHLLLVFRTQDVIALLDPDRQKIVWATRGAWWQPSDADPLPDGDLLVFDSNGHGADGLASRILKIDPRTEKVAWSYSGREDRPFWSKAGGTQQWLSGGHVLITSPVAGRIKQVDNDGNIIWEYRNPVHRTENSQTQISVLWDAQRISGETLGFLGSGENER